MRLQRKLFSPRYVLRAFREAIYYSGRFWYLALLSLVRMRGAKTLTGDTSHVTLACGFKMISRFCLLAFLYVPSFLLDLRLGLKPTRKFILVNQSAVVVAMLLGIFMAQHIYTPILNGVISHGGSISASTKLIRFLSTVTILAYVTFGLYSLLYLISRRDFVYNFVLHQCSNISLPADYQNSQAAYLFLGISILSVLAEPVFLFSTILEVFKQPKFLPHLSEAEFTVVRQVALWTTLILAYQLSAIQNINPVCTQFLMSMCEAYAHELIDKQMARIKNKQATSACEAMAYDRAELADLLSEDSFKLLAEYSCTSICRDWPEIPSLMTTKEKEESSKQQHKQQHQQQQEINNRFRWSHCLDEEDNHSLVVGSRIFLYKNLTKSLVELRELIRLWEGQFGSFHFLCVSITGLLVAQWIVIGRAELRMSAEQNMPLVYRTIFSLINFTVSNYLVFHKSDLLRQRMDKIRQKLFKLNLDLIEPGDGMSADRRIRTSATRHEVELMWSLFDQADRVTREVNFRFSGKTLYSKRCLITIFTREASLILLYMQVVDIYSTV